jgi:hypothetical protein
MKSFSLRHFRDQKSYTAFIPCKAKGTLSTKVGYGFSRKH